MGVKDLLPFLRQHAPGAFRAVTRATLAGKQAFVDVAIWMHRAVHASESDDVDVLCAWFGAMHARLCEEGATPTYVFDGAALEAKALENGRRAEALAKAAQHARQVREHLVQLEAASAAADAQLAADLLDSESTRGGDAAAAAASDATSAAALTGLDAPCNDAPGDEAAVPLPTLQPPPAAPRRVTTPLRQLASGTEALRLAEVRLLRPHRAHYAAVRAHLERLGARCVVAPTEAEKECARLACAACDAAAAAGTVYGGGAQDTQDTGAVAAAAAAAAAADAEDAELVRALAEDGDVDVPAAAGNTATAAAGNTAAADADAATDADADAVPGAESDAAAMPPLPPDVGGAAVAITNDSDALAFGAPRVLCQYATDKAYVVELAGVLAELRLSLTAFRSLCVLLGCDFVDRVPGVGPARVLPLVRQHGSVAAVLAACDAARDPWLCEAVLRARVAAATPEAAAAALAAAAVTGRKRPRPLSEAAQARLQQKARVAATRLQGLMLFKERYPRALDIFSTPDAVCPPPPPPSVSETETGADALHTVADVDVDAFASHTVADAFASHTVAVTDADAKADVYAVASVTPSQRGPWNVRDGRE